jgi:hypothetical protein
MMKKWWRPQKAKPSHVYVSTGGFQDGNQREEAESVLPKIKSWRDSGDTLFRKNHREEAKL